MEKYLNYIDGEWCKPSTGKFAPVVNPANRKTLGEVAQSEARDLDRAVQAAKSAQSM